MSKKKTTEELFDGENFNFKVSHKLKLTEKQKHILKVAHDPATKMIILNGVPGTGKTLASMLIALEKLRDKQVDGITAFRSTVQSQDGATGFLPGEISDKLKYMAGPFYQKIDELVKPDEAKTIKTKLFDLLPTSFVRSYSFRNECLILSEAQNCFESTIQDVACRAGEGSFVIIEGDTLMQKDIGVRSGFEKFYKMFDDRESYENGISCFTLDETDIVRSDLTQYIVTKILRSRKFHE